MSFTPSEVRWLIAHSDAVAAADELALTTSSQLADLGTLRSIVADTETDATTNAATSATARALMNAEGQGDNTTRVAHARALAELIAARRGALRGAKIPRDAHGVVHPDWMVCTDSAQQATPAAVVKVRFDHLAGIAAGRRLADVTCSVGTELAYAAASNAFSSVVGADLDPARLAMAKHNLPDIPLIRADATVPALASDLIVADPARRNARGRIRDPRDLIPPLPDLLDAWTTRGAELAVKCAPGIDYSTWEGQVDIVGIAGGGGGVMGAPGVKEACLYTPGLSRHARRAVVVGAQRTAELTTDDPESDDVAPPGRYILDPDGAVVRAGLVRQYAAMLGWWRIDPHIAYLSGDHLGGAFLPGQRVFEVLDTVPVKKIRSALTALKCGSVEILVRGVDLDPDNLRKKLRSGGGLSGTESLTVVVARVGTSPIAVVARAVELG